MKKFSLFLSAILFSVMSFAADAAFVFNTEEGLTALGIELPVTDAGNGAFQTALDDAAVYTMDGVGMSVTHKADGSENGKTRIWKKASGALDLRTYKDGGSLTFTAPEGGTISKVVLDGGKINFTVDGAALTDNTWAGEAASVTLVATATCNVNTITVTYEAADEEKPEVTVPTNAELWEAFKPYYNTYYGLARADQPIDKVSTFANAKMQEIMTDAVSEYKWLGDYVLGVAAGQGVTLPTDMAAANEGAWRWAVHAFFNATTGANGAAGTDFTEAGKPENWGPYYLAAQQPAADPCTEAFAVNWDEKINLEANTDTWYAMNLTTAIEAGKDVVFTLTNTSADSVVVTVEAHEYCPTDEWSMMNSSTQTIKANETISKVLDYAKYLEGQVEVIYVHVVTVGGSLDLGIEPVPTTETVYFVNAQNWGAVNAYVWDAEGNNGGAWPGVAATKEAEQIGGYDVYSYTAEAGTYAKVIFNNGSGAQTADLVWTAGKYYVKDGWYTKEEAEAKLAQPIEYESVYFVDNQGWGKTNIYTWTPEVGTWPGVAMTKEAEQLAGYDVYSYTVEKGTTFGGVIFNNGSSQTADLVWTAGKYYVKDAWYTKEEAIEKLSAPVIEWIEMPLEISNLTTMEMPVEGVTYLQLTGRDDMNDADVMLFLNNYTGEEKAYEVNTESAFMTFGGSELTVIDGSITKSVDPELGDVFAGIVHASAEEEGATMYVAFDLKMYALPPIAIELEDVEIVVNEESAIAFFNATWEGSPLQVEVSGFEKVEFKEYLECWLSIGDDVNWVDAAAGPAAIIIEDGVAMLEGEFTSFSTGKTYEVMLSGKLPVKEEPVVEQVYTENKLNTFASGLTSTLEGDVLTVNYVLNNSNATSVNVLVYNGTEVVATIEGTTTIGKNTVEVAAANLPAGVQLTWGVEVNGTSVEVPTQEEKIYSFYHPSGLDIDNNPENPTFGMLLINEGMHSVKDKTEGYVSAQFGAGIFAFTPSLDLIPNGDQPGYNGGVEFTTGRADAPGSTAYSPRRIRISDDGRIFVTSLNTDGNYLWEVNPANLNEWTPVFKGTLNEQAELIDADGNFVAAPNSGFDVKGAGENLQLAMYSANIAGIGTAMSGFRLHEYNLGTATTWATAPSKAIVEGKYAINYTGTQVVYDNEGGVWIASYRGTANDANPGLVHINADGVEDAKLIWSNVRQAGIRFNNDFTKLVVAGNNGAAKKATIYAVSKDENGAPVLTEETVIDMASVGNNLNDFAFDYAGNLYACGNSAEKLIGWAMPYSGQVVTPAASQYGFKLASKPTVVTEMVGVVKRALQDGETTIVLTHEEDGAAHIYSVVDGTITELVQDGVIARDPENAGDLLAISDIALTEDGKLVAVNQMICQSGDDYVDAGYKRGENRFYIWNSLEEAPAVWFKSNMYANWFRSNNGQTMAIKGTSANAEIALTGYHATKSWARIATYKVIDGVYTEPADAATGNDNYTWCEGPAAGDIDDNVIGTTYELNASPLAAANWIIDGNLVDPIEYVAPAEIKAVISTVTPLAVDLGKKFNGASIVTYGEKVLMVAPYATAEGLLAGVKVLDITAGLATATEFAVVDLAAAVEATAAATAVKVVEGGLVINLVADATLNTLTWYEPVATVGVVKRAVTVGDYTVVLTHEENGAAHLYKVVDGVAVAELSQEGVIAVDPENAGDFLAISDIAATEDGKLVATNKIVCQASDNEVDAGYKRGELRAYIWDDLAGAPSVLLTSKMSSNWYRSVQGHTIAYKGTSTNGTLFTTGVTATGVKFRYSVYNVIDGVYTDPAVNDSEHFHFTKGSAQTTDVLGANYQLVASPLAAANWILDGELVEPFEIVDPLTFNTEVTANAPLAADLGKKYNGTSIVTVGEQHLMVAPYATAEGLLAGVKVLDITAGLDAATEVATADLDAAVEATAAATAVAVATEDVLTITLVVDATIQTMTVELKSEPDYMEMEDEVTDLMIDTEYMTLAGTSNNFGFELYLTMGQDNLDGTFTLDPENSFVTFNGMDANFIEGYVYDIDFSAPAATALTKIELDGQYYAITFYMSNKPVEAIDIVIEDAIVAIDTVPLFGDVVDYALKMTANWTNPADGVTYPVLVEVPVYYPEATEPSEIMCTVTVGGMGDTDPWLGFGEGYLTVTTVDGVVTVAGLVENTWAGFAANITISGKLPQGPGSGLDNVQVEVKTVKTIKNGQLIIVRDGKEFNAQGAMVK